MIWPIGECGANTANPGYPSQVNTDVRTAQLGDATAIARIHSASWRVTYREVLPARYLRSLDPASLAKHWVRVLQRRSSERVVVADVAGRVAGFATSGPARDEDDPGFAGELFMLYVDPEFEGVGVGSRLIESAAQSLAARGFLWMAIWVVAANERARDFYAGADFRADGACRIDRIGGGRTEVLRMAKAIGAVVRLDLK